jgi:anti-sigma B factor antagonist
MDFHREERDGMTLIAVRGEIDSSTAEQLQEYILPAIVSSCRVLLDVSQVGFMSSAGLRIMLMLYRQTKAVDGALVLIGVSTDIQDAMNATGFLKHFILAHTIEEGLEVLTA